jgi:4-amino-4-deoxy-L-arabinose transferase-like glycosyltransferase
MTTARSQRSTLSGDLIVLFAVALVDVVVHVLFSGQYGFHRDELDIIMSARQLDWGYVAYPPLTPLLARIGLELFGPSLVGLRLLPALGQGLVVVLTGLMARDFGGSRSAQVLAAFAAAIAPVALTAGLLIQYLSFDYLWWVVAAFCVVRLLKTEDPRWWLGIGAAIGLGVLTKYTMIFFAVGLAAGILLSPARRYLRSPWLWAGVGLAFVIVLPNLLWQVRNDLVYLRFVQAIHTRDLAWGRAEGFLPNQFYANVNPLALPFLIAGLYFVFFAASGRRFRAIGWTYLVALLLFMATQGRFYYIAPAYPMLLAAGAAWLDGWLNGRDPRRTRAVRGVLFAMLSVGAVLAVALALPVAPINSALWSITAELGDNFREMVGWPELVEQVAGIYQALPPEKRARAAILAGNYGEAGALDLYGPTHGLPPPISGGNSLWARGYGDPPPETVILVGFDPAYAERLFQSCQPAGQVKNRYGVRNEESERHTTLYVCGEPWRPWPQLWPDMQWFQ